MYSSMSLLEILGIAWETLYGRYLYRCSKLSLLVSCVRLGASTVTVSTRGGKLLESDDPKILISSGLQPPISEKKVMLAV